MSKDKIGISIVLNLNRQEDAQAYRCLQQLDKAMYKSYRAAIVAALCECFGDKEPTGQAAFLRQVESTVLAAVEKAMHAAPSKEFAPVPKAETEKSLAAALEFAQMF